MRDPEEDIAWRTYNDPQTRQRVDRVMWLAYILIVMVILVMIVITVMMLVK